MEKIHKHKNPSIHKYRNSLPLSFQCVQINSTSQTPLPSSKSSYIQVFGIHEENLIANHNHRFSLRLIKILRFVRIHQQPNMLRQPYFSSRKQACCNCGTVLPYEPISMMNFIEIHQRNEAVVLAYFSLAVWAYYQLFGLFALICQISHS